MSNRLPTIAAMIVAASALAVAAIGSPRPAAARDYPVCQTGQHGASSTFLCYFDTYEQCRATTSGAGGGCYDNPLYRPQAQRPPQPAGRTRSRGY